MSVRVGFGGAGASGVGFSCLRPCAVAPCMVGQLVVPFCDVLAERRGRMQGISLVLVA